MNVKVTDAPYLAKGDGVSPDRAAIQAAIDDVCKAGGGTVEVPGDRTYLTAGLVLRTGVELHLGDGAVLLQDPDKNNYVKPVGEFGYEPYELIFGHNYSTTIKWSHTWYKNYPFIFAQEGTHDFKLTGKGTLRMVTCIREEEMMRTCPIGFFRVHDFEISGVSIRNYHGYAMMPFTCYNGLIKDVDIREWSFGNGDGICMMNCHDMRVTGCHMFTGDDSLYIFSSYRDPRGGNNGWWNSDEPVASENIEVDHNDLTSNHCKAFGMILWGIDCPDQEKVEVRNVYVHDNFFKTMGNWLYNPYTTKTGYPPVTDFRWENNRIEGIEENFFETHVSGQTFFHSAEQFLNADFKDGRCFWMMKGDARAVRDAGYEHGEINGEDASIYEGLWLHSGRTLLFKAKCGGKARLFVRNTDTNELIASQEFNNDQPAETRLYFTVPVDGNCYLGIENGSATITDAHIAGNFEAQQGYHTVEGNGGKYLFYYDV